MASLHWEILITPLSQFPLTLRQTQKWMPSFITVSDYEYYCADWDGLCDHLRDVHGRIFKLGTPATTSEFCKWVQVGIDVYFPHCKYQLKPHSSSWFSSACAATTAQKNSFFCLHQKNKSSESKGNFRQTSFVARGL